MKNQYLFRSESQLTPEELAEIERIRNTPIPLEHTNDTGWWLMFSVNAILQDGELYHRYHTLESDTDTEPILREIISRLVLKVRDKNVPTSNLYLLNLYCEELWKLNWEQILLTIPNPNEESQYKNWLKTIWLPILDRYSSYETTKPYEKAIIFHQAKYINEFLNGNAQDIIPTHREFAEMCHLVISKLKYKEITEISKLQKALTEFSHRKFGRSIQGCKNALIDLYKQGNPSIDKKIIENKYYPDIERFIHEFLGK
jgi:hypothetical protein